MGAILVLAPRKTNVNLEGRRQHPHEWRHSCLLCLCVLLGTSCLWTWTTDNQKEMFYFECPARPGKCVFTCQDKTTPEAASSEVLSSQPILSSCLCLAGPKGLIDCFKRATWADLFSPGKSCSKGLENPLYSTLMLRKRDWAGEVAPKNPEERLLHLSLFLISPFYLELFYNLHGLQLLMVLLIWWVCTVLQNQAWLLSMVWCYRTFPPALWN